MTVVIFGQLNLLLTWKMAVKALYVCFVYSRHHQKVHIVNMILATGMRNITWTMEATVVTHLVLAEVAGNLSDQAIF